MKSAGQPGGHWRAKLRSTALRASGVTRTPHAWRAQENGALSAQRFARVTSYVFASLAALCPFLFVAAAVAALWGYRVYTTGDTSFSLAWLLPARPEPRLSVMEQASVDSKRKLVLIRRDDVEHLIMTGGPVDRRHRDRHRRARRCHRAQAENAASRSASSRRRPCSPARRAASARPSTSERHRALATLRRKAGRVPA